MKTVPSTIPSEWVQLSLKLKQTQGIKKSRVGANSLFNAHQDGRIYMETITRGNDTEIIAFGALWKTRNVHWLEMGSIWVDPKHQGQGISLRIFSGLMSLISRDKSIFLISNKERIIKIARAAEWQTCRNWKRSPCVAAIDPNRPLGGGREIYYRLGTAS